MSLTEQNPLFSAVAQIIHEARKRSYSTVNTILLATYWQIGQLICEDERNLNNMRAFYRAFPIWNAVRTELSWTHYRLLSRVEDEDNRSFYLSQSIDAGWNSRTPWEKLGRN